MAEPILALQKPCKLGAALRVSVSLPLIMMIRSSSLLCLGLLMTLGCVSLRANDVASSLQPFVDDQSIAGAVTLVVGKEGVKSLETVGFSDLKAKTPMAKDAMFWIASMTKPMTSMALMMLVEEGKLSIDDPVERHLMEFKGQMLIAEKTADHMLLKKPSRPITIKDLLTHSSGLISKSPLDEVTLDGNSLHDVVLSYALSPLQFDPGSKWSYCNPGINTLGRLIEVASGKSYADFMQERLFTPLGMKDTTFWPDKAHVQRIAKSYKPTADKMGLEETTITHLNADLTDRKRMPMPAGGLFSCAADLAQIYAMVLNGGTLDGYRYLKEETLKQMETSQLGEMKVSFSDGMHMGLGFHIVNTPVGVTAALSPGSFGHGGAYGTQAWIDPVRRLGIVLLIQRAGLPNSDRSDMRAVMQKTAMEKFGK
ncbi:MAG: serine hydrolase [Verrucomicrobiaceae bacterium]|nr:serine hydrolase [Verrucomicrobiaceae bacterium]